VDGDLVEAPAMGASLWSDGIVQDSLANSSQTRCNRGVNKPFTCALSLFFTAAATAADYQGASAVLKQLAEKALTKTEVKKADPVEDLRLKVDALKKDAATLSPQESAKRWLALLDAYLTIPSEVLYTQRSYESRLDLNTILAALPPATAWDEIGRELADRKTSKPLQDDALRLLIAALRGDEQARKQAVEGLRKTLKGGAKIEDYQKESIEEMVKQVETVLGMFAASGAAQITEFEKVLSEMEKGGDEQRQRHGGYLQVPDLVRFSDEKKAEPLLVRVLKLELENLSFEGERTRALAARLALKNVATMKKPLWSLVTTLDDVPLYEAMKAKFPDQRGNDYDDALQVYFISLIAADRAADALKLLKTEAAAGGAEAPVDLYIGNLDEMGRQGLGAQVHAFLKQLLTDDPAMPYWRQYIELSARQNASAEALKLLGESLVKKDLPADAKAEIQSHRYLALLAADQREEGVSVLRELVKAGPKGRGGDHSAKVQEMKKRWEQVGVNVSPEMLEQFEQQAGRFGGASNDNFARDCAKLAMLGRLLEKPELAQEALDAVLAPLKDGELDPNRASDVHGAVEMLLKLDRGPEAEALVVRLLGQMASPDSQKRGWSSNANETLAYLARVYDQAGRHEDVLAVLEQSPSWMAPDLAGLEGMNAGATPLLLIAARALDAAGRKPEARRIIRRAVQDYPANDAIYAMLLRLGADEPMEALLDRLAQRDRFQERPLIWKARVLLDAGKVDEAEKAVRAAIGIDPSDGEQGKGDRMRAYAILAEVLEKKGDAATAKIMRGAVSAIRKSEDADDWWESGLLGEAVKRYEAALLDFADAYCIQSRLALRYSELGQFEKAEQHYLRAFELMPDSFGRVESHCFGCEGAFKGKRAQNVADKVFTQLASKPPVKAQVHYLLGYLRSAQDRDQEAADAYRLAVKTDPDYLNAWKSLAQLADEVQMSREEAQGAALQLLRLDPSGRHSSPDLKEVRDFRLLWKVLVETEQSLPPTETGPLMELKAAKARMESLKASGGHDMWNTTSYPSIFSQRSNLRHHLTDSSVIQSLSSFIESLGRM